MLVLSRHVGESIVIGNIERLVEIKVIQILGNRVQLGVKVPDEISICRKEAYDPAKRDEPKTKKSENYTHQSISPQSSYNNR